jgi:hypothetical protein
MIKPPKHFSQGPVWVFSLLLLPLPYLPMRMTQVPADLSLPACETMVRPHSDVL